MCYNGESWHTLINQALSKFAFVIPNVIEQWYNPVTLLSSLWKFMIPSSFPEGVNNYPEFLSSAVFITPSFALPIKYSIWDVKITWINQLSRLHTNSVYNLQKLTLAFMRSTESNAFPQPEHLHLWKAFWARLPHHHHFAGLGLIQSQCTWAECHRSFQFHPPPLHLQTREQQL